MEQFLFEAECCGKERLGSTSEIYKAISICLVFLRKNLMERVSEITIDIVQRYLATTMYYKSLITSIIAKE